MMAEANSPILYWGDALLILALIHNCVPSKLVTSTPYKLMTKAKPDLPVAVAPQITIKEFCKFN